MALDVSGVALAGPPAPSAARTRRTGDLERRQARLALAAVTAIPLFALVICAAATRTAALQPQTARPAQSWLTGPLRYLGFQMPIVLAILLVVAMFGAYLLAIRHARHLSTRAVLCAVLAFNVIVLLGPPLFSTDLFSYQAYARMFTAYHTNPYTHGPSTIMLNSVYPFIDSAWINTPSVYGPLFTLASGALAGASVPLSEIAFRLIAVGCSLAIALLLWRAAKLRDVNPRTAVAIYGLNPLVTLFAVGGAHNDLLMLLLAMLGIYAMLRSRDALSGVAIVAAAAIKITGGVLLPFALAARCTGSEPERGAAGSASARGLGAGARGTAIRLLQERRRLLAGAILTAIVVGVPSVLVFGSGLVKMISTLQNVQGRGHMQSVPGALLGIFNQDETHGIALALGVLLVAFWIWLLRRVWQQRMDWLDGAGWATVGLLLSAGDLLPWYVCWLIPIVALSHQRRLWHAAVWMTGIGVVMGVASFIPSGLGVLRI